MSTYPLLAPTILVPTFEQFAEQIRRVEGLFDYAQIDVMDGKFVNNFSFPEIERINELNSLLKWELHLMVARPLIEMKKWAGVKNVFRVIFAIEAEDSPTECIAFAREQGWQVGTMLKPKTPLSAVEPYLDQLDVVLFMTVEPGHQGNPFLPEVGEKIKVFTALSKRPTCAVDGGVSAETIPLLKSWGVEIFNVGSALLREADTQIAYYTLTQALKDAG